MNIPEVSKYIMGLSALLSETQDGPVTCVELMEIIAQAGLINEDEKWEIAEFIELSLRFDNK